MSHHSTKDHAVELVRGSLAPLQSTVRLMLIEGTVICI